MVQHRAHELNKGSVEAFGYPVLMRVTRGSLPMLDTTLLQEPYHLGRDILASIVGLGEFEFFFTSNKFLKVRTVLVLNHS
jgi:hypothetical protein